MNHYERRLVTLKTTIVAGVIAALGLLFLILPANLPWFAIHPTIKEVAREIGALLFASLSLTVVWEIAVKRDFIQEVLALSRLSSEVEQSGLSGISFRFYQLEWEELFRTSRSFELSVSYARSWRGAVETFMRAFAERADTSARIVLPNPDNTVIVAELALRYQKTSQEVKADIESAIADFNAIFTSGKCSYSLYLTDMSTTHGYYRFDHRLIVTVASHGKKRIETPVLLINSEGTLKHFFQSDFEHLVGNSKKKTV